MVQGVWQVLSAREACIEVGVLVSHLFQVLGDAPPPLRRTHDSAVDFLSDIAEDRGLALLLTLRRLELARERLELQESALDVLASDRVLEAGRHCHEDLDA